MKPTSVTAIVVAALRELVDTLEAEAFDSWWPLAERKKPRLLTDAGRAVLYPEWRSYDPAGYAMWKRARRALDTYDRGRDLKARRA